VHAQTTETRSFLLPLSGRGTRLHSNRLIAIKKQYSVLLLRGGGGGIPGNHKLVVVVLVVGETSVGVSSGNHILHVQHSWALYYCCTATGQVVNFNKNLINQREVLSS